MELLVEILAWFGQLLLELLLQLLFEILAELGLKAVRTAMPLAGPARPPRDLVGYILLGGVLGRHCDATLQESKQAWGKSHRRQ